MTRERWAYYLSLLASCCLLLSILVPHEHHVDGMPCFHWLTENLLHSESDTPLEPHEATEHSCGCVGHNQALNYSLENHEVTDALLFPWLTLYDYLHTLLTVPETSVFTGSQAFYIEALYDTWIVRASGLRAPPCVC